MKFNYITKSIIPALAVILSLSSCLKDDNPSQDFENLPDLVEIPDGTPNTDGAPNSLPAEFVSSSDPINITVPVRYNSTKASPGITVTLEIDQDVLDSYNEVKGSNRVMLPQQYYSLPSLTVTIPAGENEATLPLSFINSDQIPLNQSFAIPLKIKSVTGGTISGNFGSAVVLVAIKNKYDGIWTVTGTMTDVVSPGLTGYYPMDIQLITQESNSVAMYDGINVTNNFAHPIVNTASGQGSYYGNFSPIFHFDASGNITSVTNYYGSTNGSNRNAILDPSGINKYTESGGVKKFDVSYYMIQSGSNRTHFEEHFEYVEPR